MDRRRAEHHQHLLQEKPKRPAKDLLQQRIKGMDEVAGRRGRVHAQPCRLS
jgi:hypothetical protein